MGIKAIIILFLAIGIAHSQPETETWYFGLGAGLDFTQLPPKVISGPLRTNEGCSIFCGQNGKPLFYTDGQTIWNRNNEVMLNGKGLMGHPSSSQSAVVIEVPGNRNIYYVVTALNVGRESGLNYSVVDMRLDNGLGGVTEKNINLHNRITEKITVCATPDYKTYWLIAHEWKSNRYLSFKVDSSGINTNPVISDGQLVFDGATSNTYGYMKASPNSEYLVNAHQTEYKLELSKFDYKTGKVDVVDLIDLGDGALTYGLEFSPDSKIIYVSSIFPESKIYQILHPLLAEVDETMFYELGGWSQEYKLGGLQLGPDNRLYVSNAADSSLGVVKYPWLIGENAEYERNAISTLKGTYTDLGLPNFLTNYFYDPMLCGDYLYDERNGDTSRINLVKEYTVSAINVGEAQPNMKGALWSEERLNLAGGFTAEFQVELSKGGIGELITNQGGTGFAFVLQNTSNSELSHTYDGLGYDQISNAFAIEFDQYKDEGEEDNNHIAIIASKGKLTSDYKKNGIYYTSNIPELEPDNRLYKCLINYHNNKLEIYFSPESYYLEPQIVIENFNLSDYIDMPNGKGFVGITAATTLHYQQTAVKYLRFCEKPYNGSEVSSVATKSITDYAMSIIPNPATDRISINLDEYTEVNNFKIYNLRGGIIFSSQNEYKRLQKLEIDVSSLTNGVYIIKLETEEGVKTGKFLINK